MALINCPECNARISDKAIACPHCGAPVEQTKHELTEATDAIDAAQKLQLRKRKSTIAAWLLMGTFAAVMYVFGAPGVSPPTTDDASTATNRKTVETTSPADNAAKNEAALAKKKSTDAAIALEKEKRAQRELANAQKKAANEERVKELVWIEKGKDTVRTVLKDSQSAQFANVYFYRGKDGWPLICGKVNSKNGFGGYSGYQRFISGGTPQLTYLEEQVSDFHKLWNRLCRG
ncbi:zinc ribbon domain-containing protein [Candidimonas sp. SYP-B2681]|uniref:zinc-ribbon domain-containing protein n=1 Tax=Candidimonas sp. SYP-B2681 TaxID=2497686 RepID=UPI000F898792|nr:zinc ribbon domain-containing protein [Candidimonas sp. SYP-B2681]RTZ47616.1 zinc ribbon domain-containing protein [Candidimonas sp. SYP-B2681]